jgi:hypothetical protein
MARYWFGDCGSSAYFPWQDLQRIIDLRCANWMNVQCARLYIWQARMILHTLPQAQINRNNNGSKPVQLAHMGNTTIYGVGLKPFTFALAFDKRLTSSELINLSGCQPDK